METGLLNSDVVNKRGAKTYDAWLRWGGGAGADQ